jgi:hemerythrin-like domain-containing protein
MSSQVSTWKSEHRTFSALLEILEKQANMFHQDLEPNYDLMLEIVNYMKDYADRYHHPMEDRVFAVIAERVPEVREIVWELKREHGYILDCANELASDLESVLGGTVMSRNDVEDRAKRYIETFRRHIFTEEQGVLMDAAAKLTKEDWAKLAEHSEKGEDPLTGKRYDQRYSALRREIESQTI